MERTKLTPREELSKERRIAVLAAHQYKNGYSIAEMNADFEKQKAENIAKLDESRHGETDTTQSSKLVYNSAVFVLSYLIPENKKYKKLSR